MLAADAFAIQKAITGSDLSPAARSVMRILIDFSDKSGECFPAVTAVMERCGYCDRTVRSKIKELVSKGWLIKTEQFRKNGSQTSNYYAIQQPQKIVKIEEMEEVNQPIVKDKDQGINQLAIKNVEQAANEGTIKISQNEYAHEQPTNLEKTAQKNEALLSKAMLPLPPAYVSYIQVNHKSNVEPLSRVFFNMGKDIAVKSFCQNIWDYYAHFFWNFMENLKKEIFSFSYKEKQDLSVVLTDDSLSIPIFWKGFFNRDFIFNIKDLR